jgi:uncharacterized membrane protein YeaQ/YmgE (transglycosylase-associated protein family)
MPLRASSGCSSPRRCSCGRGRAGRAGFHGGSATAAIGAARAADPAAPSVVVFGSYFPAWIVCAIAGVVGAVIARFVLARLGVDEFLPLRLVVYLCLAIAFGLAVWLFYYAGAPA